MPGTQASSPVPEAVGEFNSEANESDLEPVEQSPTEETRHDRIVSARNRTRRRPQKPRPRSPDGSDDSSAAGSGDYESDIDIASRLSKVGLFKAYVRKLEDQPESTRRTRETKGPRLVESFIDYVHGLESRISSLEERLDANLESTEEEEKEEDDVDKDNNNGADVVSSLTSEFKIKFFHIDEEVDSTGRFKEEREDMLNTYHSSTPDHFIRVVYRWRDEKSIEFPPSHNDEEMLSPEDIEVVGFRIASTHFGSFFKGNFRFGFYADNIIEVYKPYRCIIRSLANIRKHLDTLEAKMGSGDMSKGSDHTKVSTAEDQREIENECKISADTSSFYDQPKKPLDSANIEDLPMHERQEELTHFRELCKFFDTYLKPQIVLYENIREGLSTKIAFENLWMLFNFNETIFCQIRRGLQEVVAFDGPGQQAPKKYATNTRLTPQAYRVVYAEGGIGVYEDQVRNDGSILTSTQVERPTPHNQENIAAAAKEKFCPLIIYCFSVESNAERYTPVKDFFVFKPFEGEVDITSLEAYPLRFHRQKPHISEMLLERGRKFIDMTSISHMTYDGLTVGDDREEVVSSVIVDIKLFHLEGQSKPLVQGPLPALSISRRHAQVPEVRSPRGSFPLTNSYSEFANLHEINPFLIHHLCDYEPGKQTSKSATDAIKEHMEANDFICLLPGEVPGFVLRSRRWDINLLQWAAVGGRDDRPAVDTAGWKDLVLPPGHKDIVLAMVKSHTANTRIFRDGIPQVSEVDLVKGKGKGCIILIHGAPGVGKTSTAECVAAYTRRPLFPITCGNIGYQPDEVEKNLDRLFNLAHRWGCVLLLDEADVFLAKRNKEDIKRNGLVSIFLRTLEYYSGILFLTTNRVGAIDDAFRSRLHLTLYYPHLDRRQSRKVWRVNLRRLKEINEDREKLGHTKIHIDKKKILKYADLNFEELHWNGRQIRNAFQSALALADFATQDTGKTPTLSFEQFDTIARASLEFDHYLQSTHGFDEDKMAARDRVRGSYKHTEVKLKSLPLSDESDSSSDSAIAEATSQDPSQSAAESERPPQRKKGKSRKIDSKEHRKGKKARKDNTGGERKKGKEKAKDVRESDRSSDSDE
ncbi:hypothetical protein F5Y13DRAFT_203189 [Hypoxylon sp. FL1857]|nr:hypothetical protein F5Y13DRAFT_203189 [Hypoxylon sp. FL1857]